GNGLVEEVDRYRGSKDTIIIDIKKGEYTDSELGILRYYQTNHYYEKKEEKRTGATIEYVQSYPEVKYLKGTIVKQTKNELVIKWMIELKDGNEGPAYGGEGVVYQRVDENGNSLN